MILVKNKDEFKAWFARKWAEWDITEARRTTQQELADYLGVSRSSIAHYLSGRKTPDGDNLKKIADKFGGEVYEVLNHEPPPEEFAWAPDDLAFRLSIGKKGYCGDRLTARLARVRSSGFGRAF